MSARWLLFFLPGLAVMQAQHGSIAGLPFSTPQDVAEGQQSFKSQCAACHGLDASGGSVAPSLVSGTFKHGGSDDALFAVITKGVPGTAMSAFPLGGKETWQIIAFLRSMNISKAAGKAPGDAAKGARVYAANNCGRCHTNGTGSGGFFGPDLSTIGSHRLLDQIESSIVDPNAEVTPDYWSVTAQTKAGQTVTGMRMNEDMDSIQIRERNGHLRTLMKAELSKFEIVRTSPMPSFKGKLSATELQDLVAYLASLREPAATEGAAK
jgi:putative heme-binding domain-containing protein